MRSAELPINRLVSNDSEFNNCFIVSHQILNVLISGAFSASQQAAHCIPYEVTRSMSL